jgi:hypothetical protein
VEWKEANTLCILNSDCKSLFPTKINKYFSVLFK